MDFEEAAKQALSFRDEREWGQFHNPKDLAIAISTEAAELLEVFLWSGQDTEVEGKRSDIAGELADVMIYCIHLADYIGMDIPTIINAKMLVNEERYPAKKSCGNARKYTDL